MPLIALDIEIAEEIKRLIDKDISVHYTTGFLADKTATSESRLKALFKKVFHTTLYAYLLQQRMQYAKELLHNDRKQIRDIAKLTGYKNYSNFIRAFKKHTGYTPVKYRKFCQAEPVVSLSG